MNIDAVNLSFKNLKILPKNTIEDVWGKTKNIRVI